MPTGQVIAEISGRKANLSEFSSHILAAVSVGDRLMKSWLRFGFPLPRLLGARIITVRYFNPVVHFRFTRSRASPLSRSLAFPPSYQLSPTQIPILECVPDRRGDFPHRFKRRNSGAPARATAKKKNRRDAGATKGNGSFAVLLDEWLVARVGAEVGEIRAVVDGGEVAEA
jgi:hypothetical protein